MDPPPHSLSIFRHRFDDFDAFSAAAKNWHLRFRQLDHGPFVGEMEQVQTGPVAVTRCRFNRRIEQLGTSPPGCWTFGVTQPDHAAFRWRKFEVRAGDLLGFAEDIAMDCRSAPGFHLFAVSIAEPLLEDAARSLGLGSHRELLGRERVVACPADLIGDLRRSCRAATRFAPKGPASERAFIDDLADALPRLILRAFREGEWKLPVPTTLGRRRALRLATEAIREATEPIQTVAELSRITGESERMLRYAFVEVFGVSPKTYLQARRLNAVRRELLHGGTARTIVDIANRQGFWHMGQLAADYRKMFGELPSVTLKRRRN